MTKMKRFATFLYCVTLLTISHAATPMDSLISMFKTSATLKAKTASASEVVLTPDTIKDSPVSTTYPLRFPITTDSSIETDLMELNFDAANETVKRLTIATKHKREGTDWLNDVSKLIYKGEAGLRGVDNIVVVDSVVVDKANFLAAYPSNPELGMLTLSEKGDVVQYQTQLNGMVLRPQQTDTTGTGTLHLVRYYLENGKLAESTLVEGVRVDGDLNYPFLMPDGQTLYFAARSTDGYGNYDLYATRYDSEGQRFYQAENMGFPYNSYANDYMLVIDEVAQLGWFASDRYQPADKVCVYTFIPNTSRHTIDYEAMSLDDVKAAARLRPWSTLPLSDEQKKEQAMAQTRVHKLASQSKATANREFEFVLNDNKTCYQLDEFASEEARRLCQEWIQKSKNLTALNEQLQKLRETPPFNTQQIFHLEDRIPELQEEIHTLGKKIRAEEHCDAQ